MPFMELKELRVAEVVQSKARIALIVKASLDSHLIFFRDGSYRHVHNAHALPLQEGTLDFLPHTHLSSSKPGRVVLLGKATSGQLWCAAMDLQQECVVETRQIEQVQPDSTTKYILYQPQSDQTQQAEGLYLVRIQEDVENGIAVAVFDFWLGIWCDQMIALSSKFLLYKLIPTPQSDALYRQPQDIRCHSFALVSSGERYDSIHYSKIKFAVVNEGGGKMVKVKFIITRELRIKRQMTIVGGRQSHPDRIMLIGNAKRESNDPHEIRSTPALVALNTASIQNNQPQELTIVSVGFGREMTKQSLQIRNYLGLVQGELIVMLLLPFGKIAFARMGQYNSEIYFQSEGKIGGTGPFTYRMSAYGDCFYRYELECETFFQKIKKAPSKVSYQLVKIYGKQQQYRHLLTQAYAHLDPAFTREVLSLL